MIFLFPRWDMLIPWRVIITPRNRIRLLQTPTVFDSFVLPGIEPMSKIASCDSHSLTTATFADKITLIFWFSN